MTAFQKPVTFHGMHGVLFRLLYCLVLLPSAAHAITRSAGDDVTNQQKITALITELGDSDYATRESATQQLRTIADHAIDQLLDAANQSNDLEIALRSQWILETVSLVGPDDPPEVTELLKNFSNSSLSQQISTLSRLVRLENNVGIKPLARLIRTNRSASISYLAALVLLQEWRPNDPYWPILVADIPAELNTSQRPSALLIQ
ncbi:MAG: hypothetical protein HN345_13430, partial [Planctomycetaceae bacterium]|nr:hypothetical protein [Planctomycetaceae bacterium]